MIWINYQIWINFVYLFTTHDISSSQPHHNTSSLYCSADSQRQYKPFVLQSPEKSESGRQYKPFVLQQLTQEHNTNRLYCRRLGGSSYHICWVTGPLHCWWTSCCPTLYLCSFLVYSICCHIFCIFCPPFIQDGKTDVVANDAGDRTTPAVVAFTDHDQVSVNLSSKPDARRHLATSRPACFLDW